MKIQYLQNIHESAATIFEGLAVTMSHMFRKPTTVQYPDRMEKPMEEMLPPGYRGRLNVNTETCTACSNCQKACPIDVIDMKGARTERKKGLTLVYFNIHHGKCMYCNLCVEACPVDVDGETAIHFLKRFEGATFTLDEMIESFVPAEESRTIDSEAADLAAKKAAEKAKKEEGN